MMRWVGLSLLLLPVACASQHRDRNSDPGPDAAARRDASDLPDAASAGSGSDASAAADSCNPTVTRRIAWDKYGSSAFDSPSVFTWAGDRIVGLWTPDRAGPTDVQIAVIDPSADTVHRGSVWPDQVAIQPTRIAAANDVLAVVAPARELDGSRGTCQVGLVRLSSLESIQDPTRYSDPPKRATILNEANDCDVATLGDGFVVLWQQYVDDTEGDQSVFAQRIAPDGNLRGERMTLFKASKKPGFKGLAASLGDRVAVAVASASSDPGTLFLIDAESVRGVPVERPSTRPNDRLQQVKAAHGGFLARSESAAWLLDRDGHILPAVEKADLDARIGPLGHGYVEIAHPDYLTARTSNSVLGSRSKPVALSDDRSAAVLELLADASGDNTAVVFSGDSSDLTFAVLGCGETPAEPLGPQPCPTSANPKPLDPGCTDEICYGVLRFDYLTLGLRGWAVISAPRSETSAERAGEIASQEIAAHDKYASTDAIIPALFPGVYRADVAPTDFGAVAAIGERSGAVVFSAGVVWSGRGAIYSPAEWNPVSDLACAEAPVEAANTFVDIDGPMACPPDDDAHPPAIGEALDAALRSNLAAGLAKRGPLTAYAFLYTPTVGACDASVAEYIVILSALRD